jgi:hypothetical protein
VAGDAVVAELLRPDLRQEPPHHRQLDVPKARVLRAARVRQARDEAVVRAVAAPDSRRRRFHKSSLDVRAT